jgi:hypothetical protein
VGQAIGFSRLPASASFQYTQLTHLFRDKR